MEFWLFLNTFLLIKGNFTLSKQKDPLRSPEILSNLFHQSTYEVHVQNFYTGIINILFSPSAFTWLSCVFNFPFYCYTDAWFNLADISIKYRI